MIGFAFCFGIRSEGCVKSVYREGDIPSSMDGVPDLRDHNSIMVNYSDF